MIKFLNRLIILAITLSDIYLISLFSKNWLAIVAYTFLCLGAISGVMGTERERTPIIIDKESLFDEEEKEE